MVGQGPKPECSMDPGRSYIIFNDLVLEITWGDSSTRVQFKAREHRPHLSMEGAVAKSPRRMSHLRKMQSATDEVWQGFQESV